MSSIVAKSATLEYTLPVDAFILEWNVSNPGVEPTQNDYDEWLMNKAYEWVHSDSFSPIFRVPEDT